MAKKAGKSVPEGKAKPRKKTVRFDLTNKQVTDMPIGSKVTATVTGTVRSASMEEPPHWEGDSPYPGHVEIVIDDVNFEVPNEFEELSEED